MNLPQTVTAEDLARLAAPDETHAVRVIVRQPGNTGPYTLRGRFRRYVARRDEKAACHVLDVPLSLWMEGVPEGAYHDNLSVAHDLQAARAANKAPLVMLVIPWGKVGEGELPSKGPAEDGSKPRFQGASRGGAPSA